MFLKEGMEGRKKSKMIPGFVRVTRSTGTVNRNKDIMKSYYCVLKGEREDNAFNFGNTKLEYHGINRMESQQTFGNNI